jgi:hypothetical protein
MYTHDPHQAARNGRASEATVNREAINHGRRLAAGERILAARPIPVGDPAELRTELDEERGTAAPAQEA